MYDETDFAHEPGPELDWQESVVLLFWDEAGGVGGFLRIGAEPNRGTSQVHFDLATADGLRFRQRLVDGPLRPQDRTSDGFAAGPLSWRISDKGFIEVSGKDADAQVDLRLYDDMPSLGWRFIGPEGLTSLAANHYESSGRVEGRVRLGERTFLLKEALGHRDHSWGRRDVSVMRSFRWVAGTFGPMCSFSSSIVHLADGRFMKAGWVHRDGKTAHAVDVDIDARINVDGLTTRGGTLFMRLEDGTTFETRAEVIDGFVTSYRSDHGGPGSHVGVEGLARCHSGALSGFCDFNVCNNISGGQLPAVSVCEDWATLKAGLSRRPPRSSR